MSFKVLGASLFLGISGYTFTSVYAKTQLNNLDNVILI